MSCCGKKPAASAFVRAKDKWNEYAENYRQRLEICGNCIELKRFHSFVPLGTPATKLDNCRICGCVILLKAGFSSQHCPVGKW